MDTHLVALKARLIPMRAIGMNLLTSAIRAYNVLWPGCAAPVIVDELAKCLMASEERLDDWRSSAARVGADEALSYVLSWYEELDLEMLKTVRDGSRWLSDPEHIQRRQELAYSLIQYAPVHSFVPGERVPQSEELEVDGEDGDEDEEQVDEEIQIDTPPDTTRGTTSAAATKDTTEISTSEPAKTDAAASAPSS